MKARLKETLPDCAPRETRWTRQRRFLNPPKPARSCPGNSRSRCCSHDLVVVGLRANENLVLGAGELLGELHIVWLALRSGKARKAQKNRQRRPGRPARPAAMCFIASASPIGCGALVGALWPFLAVITLRASRVRA